MYPFSLSLHKHRPALVVLLALICLLLSSCGTAEMDITVYSGDRYQYKVIFNLPAQVVESYGTAYIENSLDEAVAAARAEGIDIRWRKLETQQTHVIQYELATGIVAMTDAESQPFAWREVLHDGSEAYRFELQDLDLSGGMFQGFGFTLTLRAGKILESNGTQVDARTVRWINPRQTPYAIVVPKSTAAWMPLAGAGLLLAGAGLLLLATAVVGVVLVVTGRLKAWGSAGISAGKWRVQAIKLGKDRSRMQQDRGKLLSELGARAWEARVAHPGYSEPYAQLEALEQQRGGLAEHSRATEQALLGVQRTRAQVESEHAARLLKLQDEAAGVAQRLSQLRGEHTAAQKRLGELQADQQTTRAELQSLNNRLYQVKASTAADSEAQAASLSNAIAALEQSLARSASEIPHLQSEIARLEAEQQPLADEVNRLDLQRAQVLAGQREALAPLDQQIADLQGTVRSNATRAAELGPQMAALMRDLGPLVDRARPASAALSEPYARLDQAHRELAEVTQKHDLLKARLSAADSGAVRSFYLVVGGVLVALVVSMLLVVVALVIGPA